VTPSPELALNARPQKYALLVGCTRYPRLRPSYQLQGPGNDVVLLGQVLRNRFQFPASHIVTLAEAQGEQQQPTRAHIQGELEKLAGCVHAGDQVVILLAGHGSQQPDQAPLDEPDGLDEVFLPADVGHWDGGQQAIPNAIRDDELQTWTRAITDQGASVWLIVDACHSGTAARGPGEVSREVPAAELLPQTALARARQQAEQREQVPWTGDAPRLAAIYAAQPDEATMERKPQDGSSQQTYGLLTYTLCQVLTQAQTPLTYRELVQRIHSQYLRWNRLWGPTPLVEGTEQDREVLGTKVWPGRSRFLLTKDAEHGLLVTGGQLHGLTKGSILAVYPPPGTPDPQQPLGHVRIHTSESLRALVQPCAHAGMPAVTKLPEGSRCEPVYVDFGSLRLKVALDSTTADNKPLQNRLQTLAAAHGSLCEITQASEADWLIRPQKGKVFLVPAQQPDQHFGPLDLDDSDGLATMLRHIAQTSNLLQLTTPATTQLACDPAGVLSVQLELLKFVDKRDQQGTVVRWQASGLKLYPGEEVAFKVTNTSQVAVDVTLLFLDSRFGIKTVYPRPGTVTDNRLPPGQSYQTPRARVNATTVGLEHMLALAVRGEGPPIDFSCLQQRTLAQAQAAVTRGNARQVLGSPLGRLLRYALFASGNTRGFEMDEVNDHALRLLSWRVAPEPVPGAWQQK
jgi:hypothetical protein